MATAKTGSFYLTETVTLPAAAVDGTRVQATIDLSSYINVPTGQAIAIESCDFVYQVGSNLSTDVARMLDANGSLGVQVSDLNPGTVFLRADNQSLVSSGGLNIDKTNNIATHTQDLYPDNFGPSNLSEAFLCVNDTLYLVGGVDGAAVDTSDIEISARLKCRVVKLSNKDWMAIAIQSTAND